MQGSLVGAGAPPCSVAAGWRPRWSIGLGLVGQGADELLDALGVVAAVAAEGAPVGQAALAGPAGDRLGRDVQPAGDLGAGQPGTGSGHAEFTSLTRSRDGGQAGHRGRLQACRWAANQWASATARATWPLPPTSCDQPQAQRRSNT